MDEDTFFGYVRSNLYGNWSPDYLDGLDTSDFPFPNTLWHVKSTKEIAIKTTILLIIAVPGLYLNSVILVVLLKNKWLWSPSIFLLGNLALVDFLTLLFCPWFMLIREIYQNFVLKNFGCQFEGFLQATLLVCNVLSVILVSYDRLASAILPTEARITKGGVPKLITLVWGVSLIISIPWITNRLYVERQWLDHLETYCVEDPGLLTIYWNFTLLLVVWVPLGIMFLTYGCILWRLEVTSRKLSSRGGGQLVARAKSRTMRVAAGVLLADCMCRIPFSFLIAVRNRGSKDINWVDGPFATLWFAATSLMYFNCTINPLIYGFTNVRLLKAMDRTPGIACCRFGSWCCVCFSNSKKEIRLQPDKNTEKIFVIEATPQSNRKLKKFVKNLFRINADAMDLSLPKLDEVSTKPTKVTPLKIEHSEIKVDIKKEDCKANHCNEDVVNSFM